MKKLLALGVLLGLAFICYSLAAAEAPPPPASAVKPVTLKLNETQLKTVNQTPDGADVTLTKKQIKKVVKEYTEFKGKTAKIEKAHVYKKTKVDVAYRNQELVSITPPEEPKKGKGKQ